MLSYKREAAHDFIGQTATIFYKERVDMKPFSDYSFIRGVNFSYAGKSEAEWRNDLSLAKRVNLNSVRIWLSYSRYMQDPQSYVAYIRKLFGVLREFDFTVMPILFNFNSIPADHPAELEESFLPDGEAYCRDMIAALKDEPNLLMYDIMNEPGCSHYIWDVKDQDEYDRRFARVWAFVRHFCAYVKQIDPDNAITVGHWLAKYMDQAADLVDVLSYHDYSSSLKGIIENAQLALEIGRKWGKPVLNTETCCIGRGNPYDLTIQTLNELHVPWFFFGLMCDGYWSDVHGVFYSDGTVRDPAAVAALLGFYRQRNYESIVPENPNREKLVSGALRKINRLLLDETDDCFNYKSVTAESLLDACDELACFLEAGQLVPMRIPPTTKVAYFRRQANPNLLEIKGFAYELAETLKKACHILSI